MVLVWVLYALVELFLYLPLISGAFLAFPAQFLAAPSPNRPGVVIRWIPRYDHSRATSFHARAG
jgi:hypothetical protein